MSIKKELKRLTEISVQESIDKFLKKEAISKILRHFKIEDCKDDFGDYSTNIAMQIFGFIASAIKDHVGDFKTPVNKYFKVSEKPSDLAEEIKIKILKKDKNKILENVSVSKNGFINFYLSDKYLSDEINKILDEKSNYGKNNNYQGKKIQVEFVSANPTGPLHLGNARGGPLGDTIASILELSGAKVEREFYVNDTGNQAKYFGETILYYQKIGRGEKVKFPQKGYPGEYIKEIAAKIKPSDSVEELTRAGIDLMVRKMKKTLEKLGISYDKFVFESEILSSGRTREIIDELEKEKYTSEKEGAVWFKGKNKKFLEDRECVLVRSDKNKTPTYYANDIAYHKNKFDLGNDLVIDVWGATHHGHINRLKQALEAVGVDPERLIIILYQFVRLRHGDKIERMAKREGTYETAEAVVEAVGKDAFRMMMLLNSPNTHLDFDLELAKKESNENPVYYLQYACARIAGILRKAQIKNYEIGITNYSQYELALIKELIKYPDLISEASRSFEVHHLPHYGIALAKKFHQFYKNCPVIKAENKKVMHARIALINATYIVLKNTLKALGINAPEKM